MYLILVTHTRGTIDHTLTILDLVRQVQEQCDLLMTKKIYDDVPTRKLNTCAEDSFHNIENKKGEKMPDNF